MERDEEVAMFAKQGNNGNKIRGKSRNKAPNMRIGKCKGCGKELVRTINGKSNVALTTSRKFRPVLCDECKGISKQESESRYGEVNTKILEGFKK